MVQRSGEKDPWRYITWPHSLPIPHTSYDYCSSLAQISLLENHSLHLFRGILSFALLALWTSCFGQWQSRRAGQLRERFPHLPCKATWQEPHLVFFRHVLRVPTSSHEASAQNLGKGKAKTRAREERNREGEGGEEEERWTGMGE